MLKNQLRSRIRDSIAQVIALSGISSFSRFSSNTLSVLTLHRILPEELKSEYPLKGLVITPDELHWLIRLMATYFEIDTVSRSLERLGARDSDKPLMAITIDDGQLDNLTFAVPVFEDIGARATFYIPTGVIGGKKLLWHDQVAFAWSSLRPRIILDLLSACDAIPGDQVVSDIGLFMEFLKSISPERRHRIAAALSEANTFYPEWARLMSWDEVRSLHAAGHEIGSHAISHGLLPQMSVDAQRREITDSGQTIAKEIGCHPKSFCYPNGSFNDVTLKILSNSLYENAVTTKWSINQEDTNRFLIGRSDIHSGVITNSMGKPSAPRIQMRLSGLAPGLRR